MIFYHFTRPERLDSILRDGLLASKARLDNGMGAHLFAVWLTTRPSLVPSLEVRRRMLRRGILCGPGCSNLSAATVCLKMVIPTTDRRLRHFQTWARKHLPNVDPSDPVIDPNYWIYAGDIPAARLSVFKHVPPTPTYWELTNLRETWVNHGIESAFPPDLEAALLEGRDGPDGYVAAIQEHLRA
jgi:hypothetical protein